MKPQASPYGEFFLTMKAPLRLVGAVNPATQGKRTGELVAVVAAHEHRHQHQDACPKEPIDVPGMVVVNGDSDSEDEREEMETKVFHWVRVGRVRPSG